MKAMVIYDSVFGNTEQIARAIGSALGSEEEIGTFRVSNVKLEQLPGLELLIVGSPTRGFRPTEAIRDFLKSIPKYGLIGVHVAAFDTRIAVDEIDSSIGRFFVKTFGYAAKPIADRLKRKGGNLIVPPEGFYVKGVEGPLKEGELERAADWARRCRE